MTRLTPAFTAEKTLNITFPAAQETLLATPDTLPTAEPATPQVSYTVDSAWLPALDIQPCMKVYVAHLHAAGKCPTAATVSSRMKKNGASVNTGTISVSANYYYNIMPNFYDVAVGDVLELALWSSVADSQYDYKACAISISRVIIVNADVMLPCNFANYTTYPTLSLGTPTVYSQPAFRIYNDTLEVQLASAANVGAVKLNKSYGLFRVYHADIYNPNAATQLSYSSRPRYCKNYVPTQIILRGLKL
jgi:hypothetical protein